MSKADFIAEQFHATYERLAPEHGYKTRDDSSVPWADVPAQNKALMTAVVEDLLSQGVLSQGKPKSLIPVPEGYVARFEHLRWVVIEAIVTFDGTDHVLFGRPTLMNRHEWSRITNHDDLTKVHVLPNGGVTVCRLFEAATDPDQPDELVVISEVPCTWEDSYNKAIGRSITLGSALKLLNSSNTAYEGVSKAESMAS